MKDMVIIKREENNVTHGYDLKEIKKFVYDGTTMQIEVMFPQESIIFEGRQAEIVYNAIMEFKKDSAFIEVLEE